MGYHNPEPHRHLAKHVLIGLKGNFVCHVQSEELSCCGICIGSDIPHTVHQVFGGLLVFLFDETGNLAEQLETLYLNGKQYGTLNETLCLGITGIWGESHADARHFDRRVLSACGLNVNVDPTYDSRIANVLESLHKADYVNNHTFSSLCKAADLSQSRLSHLFKEQVGVSLGSYLTFEKIGKTYTYMRSGEDLTTACLHAGFDSSSHFSAAYRRMFGLSFRDFRRIFVRLDRKLPTAIHGNAKWLLPGIMP